MPRTEITRFPHAVLEVKLSLHQGEEAPAWIKVSPCRMQSLCKAAYESQSCQCLIIRFGLQELLESGYLTEVHKFSKFIHGTATLLPDMVQVGFN